MMPSVSHLFLLHLIVSVYKVISDSESGACVINDVIYKAKATMHVKITVHANFIREERKRERRRVRRAPGAIKTIIMV